MKWKILLFVVLLVLISSPACADDETYIVQFNNKTQLHDTQCEGKNYITATCDKLQEYLDAGVVEFYEPDHEVSLFETFKSSDADVSQWNLDAIKIAKPWNIGCYGNDVVVGVIDSGCYAHPDLSGNLLSGKNYTSSNVHDTDDKIGHGTYVSGIIAAQCNGSYIDGIAHKAKIVPLKCFEPGVSTQVSMIIDAIYDAVDVYDCQVINMSFGMTKSKVTQSLENAIKYALDSGCIVVCAVGNDGTATEYYPAKYDGVIGVGSVDKDGSVSYFSQHNSTVDFVAPGQNIKSVSIDAYSQDSGTSFAAPHISALAAVAKCIKPDITPQEFMNVLKNTSRHPDDENSLIKQYDFHYGYGVADAEKMFDKLLKDKKHFLSPISAANNEISAVVYNNSPQPLEAKGIISAFSGTSFCNAQVENINLSPGEYRKINCGFSQGKLKFMLWSSLTDLVSLTPCREFLKQ